MADEPIVKIETHVEDAQGRLAGRYKEKLTYEGTVAMSARQVQDLEDTILDLSEVWNVANAEGPFLDDIGATVGQPRQGFDDDFYRIMIYVKMIENVSEGQPSMIISAARLVFGADIIHYMNLGLASVGLMFNGTFPPVPPSFIYTNLERILMAGVSLDYLAMPLPGIDVDDLFSFEGGTTGKGFGDLDDPSVGGYWVGLIPNTSDVIPDVEVFAFDLGQFDLSPFAL